MLTVVVHFVQLEEMRANEGVLRTRVKYLTNELAAYKRRYYSRTSGCVCFLVVIAWDRRVVFSGNPWQFHGFIAWPELDKLRGFFAV